MLVILVAMYFLWGYLGIASLVGLLVLIAMMVVNALLVIKMKKYQVG